LYYRTQKKPGTIVKIIFLLVAFSFLIFQGCSEDKKDDIVNPSSAAKVNSCESCHTNYSHLKAVHSPDPPATGGGGCGGDTPHIEPYDRVFMSGAGYSLFKSTVHGKLECTVCHNGVGNTGDKVLAHSGDFVKKPSSKADEKCAGCHPDVVAKAKNSIHGDGTGQKNMVTIRAGLGKGPDAFNQLSEMMKKGYDENCGKCHATCGDCHVLRPKAGGGGLYRGHGFMQKPDMVDHCATCHTSRGGHAYFGVAPGTVPDVHLTKSGFDCMSCHSKNEIHGDGKRYDHRYMVSSLPECTDCHSGLTNTNLFHREHLNTFSCQTCHSQDYNNCGSCHIGGEGARIPSYQGFKIGMNPLPEVKTTFKYALLRRSVMAPDSWMEYGMANLSNFDEQPTYKYTTPHNIQKITARTGYKNAQGVWVKYANCTEGCHISKNPDGSLKNKGIYLFDEDCLNWEKAANSKIVVDGKLPAAWGN
jgi:hypothetical protein